MTTPLLTVENLDIRFQLHEKTVHAVRNISFKVAKGETLALVGESGSGKSVTAMSLMRLLPENTTRYGQDSRITFDGTSILDADEKTLRSLRGGRISFIFQEPMTSLNPFMKIGTQLMEALRVHNKTITRKAARERILDLLNRVGIREAERRLKQYPHEFSGGQLQRIMIAMALLNEPSLLIADEPTTALDVTIQAEILDLLHDLQKQMGMAIIFITHDLGLAEHYSETVCVMKDGEIVERGKIKQVFANPTHPYTAQLIHSVPKGMKDPVEGNPPELIRADRINVHFTLKHNFFGKPLKTFHAVKTSASPSAKAKPSASSANPVPANPRSAKPSCKCSPTKAAYTSTAATSPPSAPSARANSKPNAKSSSKTPTAHSPPASPSAKS